MYRMVQREDIVRIAPDKLGDEYDNTVMELTHINFEGKMNWENSGEPLTTWPATWKLRTHSAGR